MLNNPVYKIAIIGQPVHLDQRFDDSQLASLKKFGFNSIQINIAWNKFPEGEPLLLQDVVTLEGETESDEVIGMRKELNRRIGKCKEHGFRTIFHFGAPKWLGIKQNEISGISEITADCILQDGLKERYSRLLFRLSEQCPGLDDIFVYTYDQHAWQCSEFGDCPRCGTIPLSERLPGFVANLCDTWKKCRPGGMMWWEPWELSAGQLLSMIYMLPVSNFGLSLHCNVGEVHSANPVDVWFRNVSRKAYEHNIPVIGEIHMASTSQEIEPVSVFMPRIVYQQIKAVLSTKGTCGVKEYYGILPDKLDVNLAMAGAIFDNPEIELDDAMDLISKQFGPAQKLAQKAMELTASAFEIYPWDVTWWFILSGHLNPCHGWNSAYIHGESWDSPSWWSSRNAIYMHTKTNFNPHPWLLEDVSLRFEIAANEYAEAAKIYESMKDLPGEYNEDSINECIFGLKTLQRSCTTYRLHMQESIVAGHIRKFLDSGKSAPDDLYVKLRKLLALDAVNQEGSSPVHPEIRKACEMLAEFDSDPIKWIKSNLLPVDESKPRKEVSIPGIIIPSVFVLGATTW
ncbi:MAG: hypothetical protein ACYCYI_02610 [Saccharofermentanales bacterium]